MAKDQAPLLGPQASQQSPLLALGDMNSPITVTGPSLEVNLGFYGPRDGKDVKFDVVACLGETPAAGKAFVTVEPSTKRGHVTVKIWKLDLSAAAGATVTKVHLLATRGSAYWK